MRILLVGGAVRNILLGRPVRDRDYLVLEATVEDFLRAHPTAKPVGKTFPVFILDGQEYSFPRADGPLADPALSLDADLALRDFTINALAMDEAGAVKAHPLALQDIQSRVLRPASARALADDPARVFRAARFAAELPDFTPHPELLEAMRSLSGTAALSAPYAERIGREVMKACAAEKPGNFLRLLDAGGCLAPWLAELAGASAIPAGPPKYHDSSVLEHTARVMDRLAHNDTASSGTASFGTTAGDALTVWMGLCHDLGKRLTPARELPRHIGHDERGWEAAVALGTRLRLPARFIQAGADAARWHMRAGRYGELRPRTRVDLLFLLKSRGVLRELFRLVRADKGLDLLPEAQADLDAALTATLPPEARDQGEKSGELLRGLRADAIRKRLKDRPPTV